MDEREYLFEPIAVIHAALRVCKDWKWQMQNPGVAPGFFNGFPQNYKNLTICSLEILVKPAQLAGMTAALNSIKLPYKE